MTCLEFCKEVLAKLGGNWPYSGALADALAASKDKKTVEQAVAKITSRLAAKRKKQS